jgi:lipid A 3-O-deacylase
MIVFVPASARAQAGPLVDGSDFEVWTGGGKVLSGPLASVHAWNVGVRCGWVITDVIGSGWLRGRFEYAVDAIPVFAVFQPNGTAIGGGFNPTVVKWNFAARERIVPYFELSGGIVFLNREMPYAGASSVNFIPSGALGLHFLRHKFYYSAEIRYLHASNANLANHNPGINTFQLRIGMGLFTHPK